MSLLRCDRARMTPGQRIWLRLTDMTPQRAWCQVHGSHVAYTTFQYSTQLTQGD